VNILHVLSQHEVTGAETYAAALIARQVRDGHRVIVVSDTFSTPVEAEVLAMRIGRRDYPQRVRNVLALRRLIRRRSIHLVHAHSRAASWVAYFATRLTRVPLVSTLHAIQPPHRSARAFSVYGEEMMAVSRSVEANAVGDLGLPRSRVRVVPNGVDLERFRPGASTAEARRALGLPPDGAIVALVGRLSGPRGPAAALVVSEVMPRVVEAVPPAVLAIAGGMKSPRDFAALVAAANDSLGAERVRHLGHLADVAPCLAAADVVIGAGRSAMEALAMGRPVVALGETDYVGVVSEATADEALRTNFGDTGARRPADPVRVAGDVAGLLKDPQERRRLGDWGRAFVERHYDVAATWRRAAVVYRRARARRARPARIPVVMYHRIVDPPPAGSRHGIWVTREAFAAQLASLARRGFTTITFSQYAACLAGARALPARPILLTFDDGYEDNYGNAFPLLKRFGMTATIFLIGNPAVTTNAWDAADGEPELPLLRPAQVREMAGCGIEFGSHTATHARLTDLPAGRLGAELADSRRVIEEWVGGPVLSLCYPYGAVNEAVKEAAAEAGYLFGVASDSGPLRIGEDIYEIRRAQVFPRTDAFGFWKKTSAWYLAYRRLGRVAGGGS
jgi:peptidoglycan/xylan/chitin deacetylase (PgdA/CDA1 family)/glycosyltransferase involved in cell wall biosynthesis